MKNKEFLTVDELVDRWGGARKRQTLANWRTRGEGPKFLRVGRTVVYPLADLREWERETNFHLFTNEAIAPGKEG